MNKKMNVSIIIILLLGAGVYNELYNTNTINVGKHIQIKNKIDKPVKQKYDYNKYRV